METVRKKIVIVGDSAAGKTSLLYRVMHPDPNEPLPETTPTILQSQLITWNEMELMVWDTAGQEDYDRLRPLTYPGTDVLIMVCSKSAYTSLLNLKFKWLREVNQHLPRVRKVLVVNKCDLDAPDTNEDIVTDEYIDEASREMKMDRTCKVSALTGSNIDILLNSVVDLAKQPKHPRPAGPCNII